jgi:hypothetical protein
MANDFKRFQVNNVTTSTGASGDALYTTPGVSAGADKESIIIGITLANTSASGVTADVFLDGKDGTDTYIVKGASIPAGSSLEVMAGNKIVVQGTSGADDVIRVSCGTANALDATISVLEDV